MSRRAAGRVSADRRRSSWRVEKARGLADGVAGPVETRPTDQFTSANTSIHPSIIAVAVAVAVILSLPSLKLSHPIRRLRWTPRHSASSFSCLAPSLFAAAVHSSLMQLRGCRYHWKSCVYPVKTRISQWKKW